MDEPDFVYVYIGNIIKNANIVMLCVLEMKF